jgi:hypothetical protein
MISDFPITAATTSPLSDVSRKILQLQVITLTWMSLEAIVSLGTACTSNSPALLAFGGDLEALKQIVGRGMGTVPSCIPGRLAFVETEDERFILEPHGPLEKCEYVRFVIGRKTRTAMLNRESFRRQRRRWSGKPSRAVTPTN